MFPVTLYEVLQPTAGGNSLTPDSASAVFNGGIVYIPTLAYHLL